MDDSKPGVTTFESLRYGKIEAWWEIPGKRIDGEVFGPDDYKSRNGLKIVVARAFTDHGDAIFGYGKSVEKSVVDLLIGLEAERVSRVPRTDPDEDEPGDLIPQEWADGRSAYGYLGYSAEELDRRLRVARQEERAQAGVHAAEVATATREHAEKFAEAIRLGQKITAIKAYRSLTCRGLVESKDVVDKLIAPRYPAHEFSAAGADEGTVIRIGGEIGTGTGDLAGYILEKCYGGVWNTTALETDYSDARVQDAAESEGFLVLYRPESSNQEAR